MLQAAQLVRGHVRQRHPGGGHGGDRVLVPGDSSYAQFEARLDALAAGRNTLAAILKHELWGAEFLNIPVPATPLQLFVCNAVIQGAAHLADG